MPSESVPQPSSLGAHRISYIHLLSDPNIFTQTTIEPPTNHSTTFMMTMNQLVYVRNTVVKGFGRGSKELGCPTANVDNINHLTIPTGIYCGLVQLVIRNKNEIQEDPGQREAYQRLVQKLPYVSPVQGMVCSFGYNPQYGNKEKSLEVHILDKYDYNFYGAELRALICKKLRDEEKYNSLEELKQAIARDILNAGKEVVNFEQHKTNPDYFLDTAAYSNGWAQ